MGDTTSLVPGFPIRTSSDPRSVDSSPRHIAASHVLHRLLMPRHPPCALKHLQTQENILKQKRYKSAILLRCSQPLSNKQTPHPTTKWSDNTTSPIQRPRTTPGVVSGPNRMPDHPTPPATQLSTPHRGSTHQRMTRKDQGTSQCLRHMSTPPPHSDDAGHHDPAQRPGWLLLRKEVIQPHLPVRLPCYDFVPIADPTFDSSPHKG